MILKASQRGGARQLARHLLRTDDNDHVEVVSLRGFLSGDLLGALSETHAIARGTKCKQFLFSLSLNPPKKAAVTPDQFLQAVDRAEALLSLGKQPRAVVLHEKRGRMHAHVVWSRIDPVRLTAVSMSFFKSRLVRLSKELFLEYGWDLPEGHRENAWKSPDSFTLADWQQAKRIGLDPRELKALFRDAWSRSDNLGSFRQALAARGFFLARGDRRGFVAVDVRGEVFSVARLLGIRTKEVLAKLGSPATLPAVGEVKAWLAMRMDVRARTVLAEAQRRDTLELAPLYADHRVRVVRQRQTRARLSHPKNQRTCSAAQRGLPEVWTVTNSRRFRTGQSLRVLSQTGETAGAPLASPGDDSSTCRQVERRGSPSLFIRAQRPGEPYDDYMAYRRACFRLIEQQQEERDAAERQMEKLLASQRNRRLVLAARIAGLMAGGRHSRAWGWHP